MKLKITLKDRDGVCDSIQEAAEKEIKAVQGITERERESLVESMACLIAEKCRTWIAYGECVTIEIDTDAGTAVVCKA